MDPTTLLYSMILSGNNNPNFNYNILIMLLFILIQNASKIWDFIQKTIKKYKRNNNSIKFNYIRYNGRQGYIRNSQEVKYIWDLITTSNDTGTYTMDHYGVKIPELYTNHYIAENTIASITNQTTKSDFNQTDELRNAITFPYVEYEITIHRPDNNMALLKSTITSLLEENNKQLTQFVNSSIYCIIHNHEYASMSQKQPYYDNKFIFTELRTTKTFDNIFLDHKQEIIDQLDHFTHNKQHYDKHGIPHKLIMLMHGPPGCGKTSVIKAMAKYTNRHLFIIDFSTIKTKHELRSIFTNNYVTYKYLTIPHSKLIFVFEDIDTSLECITKQTENTTPKNKHTNEDKKDKGKKDKKDKKDKEDKEDKENKEDEDKEDKKDKKDKKDKDDNIDDTEKLDIATVLNVFDGIIELNNVIIVITTNHVEKLHEAFVRPGRMDMKPEFKRASTSVIEQIVNHYFAISLYVDPKFNDMFAPAQITELCNSKSRMGKFNPDTIGDDIIEALEEMLRTHLINMSISLDDRYDEVND